MVIFISGSINSGKTTTAKALAKKLQAQFIDVDDVNDRVPNFNLATDISKGIALAIEDINKLTAEGKSVVVSDVIREEDRQQILAGLHEDPLFVTLAPSLEEARGSSTDRVGGAEG
jgi:gluconate kinase